jgi:hypothetical protein
MDLLTPKMSLLNVIGILLKTHFRYPVGDSLTWHQQKHATRFVVCNVVSAVTTARIVLVQALFRYQKFL